MPDDVVDRIHRLVRQQRANPGLLFGDRNMSSVDEGSVNSSDSENDDNYIPDEEDHSEESQVEDDDAELNYDDDNDYGKSMGNSSTHMNEDNNMGQPTGPPGDGTGNEHPREENSMFEGQEEDDHNLIDLEVESGENPGVVDHKNEGVEQEGQGACINEGKDNMSTEIDTVEDVTTDQDSGEENAVQGTPRYNLRKDHV